MLYQHRIRMSKRRGLSLEDKRRVILSVYNDKREPFNLKEIETIASKMGVVQQTIKEVNQSLVDDNMVLSDKIGSANFYWSFPSKVCSDLKMRKEALENAITRSKADIARLSEEYLATSSVGKNGKMRKDLLAKLTALKQRDADLDAELECLKIKDPAEIKKVRLAASRNKEAADRWTENIWVIKSYLTKRKGMSGKEADRILKIDSSFDYAEFKPQPEKKSRAH